MLSHRVQILARCVQIFAHFVHIVAHCPQMLAHFVHILAHCPQMLAHCVKILARDLGEPLIGHRQDTQSASMGTHRRSKKRHRSSNAAHWSSESRHWSPKEPHCESNRRLCDPFLPLCSYEAAHVILSDAHARADGAAPSYAIRASRRTCLFIPLHCLSHCDFVPCCSSAASFLFASAAPRCPNCFAISSPLRNCAIADAVSPTASSPSPKP